VSPIFVRPVREQLEHDRLIRYLLPKYKRKHEVATNLGDEQLVPVKIGQATYFPDLVLTNAAKLAGIVEIETGESVNNLEAMYQWVPFSRARTPFHLYVPVQGYEAARRLIDGNAATITEVWTYRPANDGFDLVRMSAEPSADVPPSAAALKKSSPAGKAKPGPAKSTKPPKRAVGPVKKVTSNKARKPAKKVAAPAKRVAAKPARAAAKTVKGRGSKAPTTAAKAKKSPVRGKGR
jgi:hypothetical protein